MPARIQFLSATPELQPQWRPSPPDVVLTNPRFGALLHVAVCRDGRPIYDQPVWAEPVGAIVVPVLADGRLVFVEVWRPVAAADEAQVVYPVGTLEARGRWSLELPRGFPEAGEAPADTARREAEEETGLAVATVTRIGSCNPNTTFFLNHLPVFQAEVAGEAVGAGRDEREQIRRRVELTWDEALQAVAGGRIICGFTQAALLALLASGGMHNR
jgi:8-oxo-dGTP pyrophosphatase MutT (NUDIX family)